MSDPALCSVEGCSNLKRKRTWCAAHYSQWRRIGEVKPFSYKWAAVGAHCVVCGDPVVPGSRRRKHCSGRCQAMDSRHQGQRPTTKTCSGCGGAIDLLETTRRGQFRRADSKLCGRCKAQTRWALTADEVVARDGLGCGICGEPVDLTVAWPHGQSRSVDHIVPRANGGLDEPSNLQLAHLSCNSSKSNRPPLGV